MEDLAVNIVLIAEPHMPNESVRNNRISEGFGKQTCQDELSRVSDESTEVFVQSSKAFTRSSDLLAQSIKKSIQLTDVLL
jgi:hypothetical protein